MDMGSGVVRCACFGSLCTQAFEKVFIMLYEIGYLQILNCTIGGTIFSQKRTFYGTILYLCINKRLERYGRGTFSELYAVTRCY